MGRKPKKPKNLPKGFGSVTMRNDTYRTNPALVRVSINGKQKSIASAPTYIKIPFNTRQLNRIKALIANNHPLARWAMAVLMMVYSGVRIGEFLRVKKADVKLGMRYFIVRKSKTPAGENRPIPINKKTLDYFKYWMELPGPYLISRETDERQVTYGVFRNRWDKVMKISNCKHTPHECRHTCATLFDDAGANDTAVKKILGHACEGVTKQVYTHKSLHQLKKAMDTI